MADDAVIYTVRPRPGVPIRALGRAGRGGLPDRAARRQGRRDPGHGGRVIVPPTEYDPETGEETSGMVEVGPEGTVTSWSWVPRPRPKHPLQTPFAWVLVRFDGADTSFLHVLPAAGTRRGLDRHAGAPRVRPRGRAGRARQGHQPLRGGREVRRERARAGDDDGGDDAPRLRVHRRRGHEQEPARVRAGQVHRPALPQVQEGLHAVAGLVPDRRRADRRDRRAAQHRHGDHLLRGERALRRASRSRSPTSAPRSSSTGPTCRSWG